MRSPKRFVWLIGAWVAATVATASVALAVVGLAGDQVADTPVQPLSSQQVEALGIQAPVSSVADPTDSTATSTSSTAGTTTTAVSDVSSTTAPPPATTTVTTAPPAPTTTAPQSAQIDSRQITGGTVVVRWTPSSVELVSASPTDGFSVDVEKRGPEKVEVEFEGDGVKSKYSAEVSDGELVVQTSVEEDD